MRLRLAALALFTSAWAVSVPAQQISEPLRGFGTSITAAYEGWFNNADGTHNFLIGYYNRNNTQAVDVPIGPNNRMEPNGPDLGQPTHFLPGRQTGVFLVTMPKEYTAAQRFTWSITVNGQTTSIPFWMNDLYEVSPFADIAVGNKPPIIKFEATGADDPGPDRDGGESDCAHGHHVRGADAAGLGVGRCEVFERIERAATQPPPPVILHWMKYRGPGDVTFDKQPPVFEKIDGPAVFNGKATINAKFSAPGEYILHVTAEDYSAPAAAAKCAAGRRRW